MSNGVLTAQVARSLQHEFDQQGYDILHDHRQKEIDQPDKLGKLRSWFGSALKREMVLADLDIAIVSHHDKKVYALIEVEETTAKPKVILGNVLATLLGNGITFQGKHDLLVGKWTTLLVMVYDPHQSLFDRCAFITEQTNNLKGKLTTPNASIGRIIVDTFTGKMQLENKLRQHLSEAVSQRGIQ
jgi:hypothetical protein